MSDTIYARPGETFYDSLDNVASGLVGTVGVRLLRDSDGTTVTARTTAGIVESPADAGRYIATLTAPEVKGAYTVFWDTGEVSPDTTASDALVVTTSANPVFEPEPPTGSRLVPFRDFRPSKRFDGKVWAQVRVEQSDDPKSGWESVDVLDLDPQDSDPERPQLRSFSATIGRAWGRLVFLHEEEEDAPCPHVFVEGPSFLPTVADVSSILRARTYSGKHPDPDNPMAVVAGGVRLGEFDENTTPTAEDVAGRIIPSAAQDVLLELGDVPGELVSETRRVTALRAATECERSYIPEQADETRTIYQTLRLTYQEEVTKLASNLQWWLLTNKPPKQRSTLGASSLGWWRLWR